MKKEESEKIENEENYKKQTEGEKKIVNNKWEQKKIKKTSVWSMRKEKNDGERRKMEERNRKKLKKGTGKRT